MDHCTKEQFLDDVKNHKLKIYNDEGVYRHIRLSVPGSSVHRFDLITWTDHLCISGDMGTFVFSRVEDMFKFFRSENLEINPSYWGEKLRSESRPEGYRRYDQDAFKERVKWLYYDFCEGNNDMDEAKKALLWGHLKSCVLKYSGNECEALSEAYGYDGLYGFEIDEEALDGGKNFTYHYIWCCYAIAWGIKMYDAREWR